MLVQCGVIHSEGLYCIWVLRTPNRQRIDLRSRLKVLGQSQGVGLSQALSEVAAPISVPITAQVQYVLVAVV